MLPIPVLRPADEEGATAHAAQLDSLRTIPGGKSLVVAVAGTTPGHRLYRYEDGKKELTPLTDVVFGSVDSGAVTSDGKRLVFMGREPAAAYGQLMVLDL